MQKLELTKCLIDCFRHCIVWARRDNGGSYFTKAASAEVSGTSRFRTALPSLKIGIRSSVSACREVSCFLAFLRESVCTSSFWWAWFYSLWSTQIQPYLDCTGLFWWNQPFPPCRFCSVVLTALFGSMFSFKFLPFFFVITLWRRKFLRPLVFYVPLEVLRVDEVNSELKHGLERLRFFVCQLFKKSGLTHNRDILDALAKQARHEVIALPCVVQGGW